MKAKRGQIVVIATQQSSTDIKMKRTFYTTYRLAKASKVGDGIVRAYKLPNDPKTYEIAKGFQTVLTISDPQKQEQADCLFNAIQDNNFDSKEAIIAAIIAA